MKRNGLHDKVTLKHAHYDSKVTQTKTTIVSLHGIGKNQRLHAENSQASRAKSVATFEGGAILLQAHVFAVTGVTY